MIATRTGLVGMLGYHRIPRLQDMIETADTILTVGRLEMHAMVITTTLDPLHGTNEVTTTETKVESVTEIETWTETGSTDVMNPTGSMTDATMTDSDLLTIGVLHLTNGTMSLTTLLEMMPLSVVGTLNHRLTLLPRLLHVL